MLLLYILYLVGMLRKLQIVTFSFVMSVHLSICMEQLCFHWLIFMKFDI